MTTNQTTTIKNEPIFLARGGCLQGKGCLVVNPPTEFAAKHDSLQKSAHNLALYLLAGMQGSVHPNRAGTAIVVDVGHGGTLSVGTAVELASFTEQLNALAREGKAWWCKTTNGGGCPSVWITSDPDVAARVATKAAAKAAEAAKPRFRVCGSCRMRGYGISGSAEFQGSPTVGDLRQVLESGGRIELLGNHPEGLLASLEAGIAAENAESAKLAIIAEESARKAEELAKAKAEKTAADIAALLAATGTTAAEWAAMSPKKQGLAMHKARMAGKL